MGFFLGLPTCLEGRLVPAEPECCCGRCRWWHCPHGVLGDRLAALCGGLSILTACSTAPSRNVQYSAWGLGSAVQLGTFPSGTLGVFKMISQIFLIFLVFFWPWANFCLSLMHKVGLKKCCFSLFPHLNISGMSSLVSLSFAGKKKKRKSLEELGDVFYM